jgi:outer membrane biosynthesis protein TonB
MSDGKKNNIYTAEDIEKYFSGRLLPAQMHAMEKAALDDPFLAEAMEGYAVMKNEPWHSQLNNLRTKFEEKKGTNTLVVPVTKSFKWWKAVAAILVIATGGWLTYLFTKSASTEDNKTIAITSLKKDSADTALNSIADAGLISSQDTIVLTEKNARPPIAQVKISQAESKLIEPTPKATTQYPKKNTEADDNQNQKAGESNAVVALAPAEKNIALAPVAKGQELNNDGFQNSNQAATKKEVVFNHTFNAEVIGPDKTPLSFANILVTSENVGTYADVKGKFRLLSSDSVLTVKVRAAGYSPRNVQLNSGAAQNTIVLDEQQVAAEDIIKLNSKVKKNTATNRRAMLLDTVLNVEPADGWSNYSSYLNNNLSPSDEILQNNIHGEVEVTFDVLSNGAVSNVNIAKSLCGDCDKEALRIIKEGPQWKIKDSKKKNGKIKIKF